MKAAEIFKNAHWMQPGAETDVPYIRGEFKLAKKIAKAEITVCGLGFYKLYINGRKIGSDLFGTLSSDFHAYDAQVCAKKFGEKTSHRIYVSKYEISGELEADNCIGIAMAPGWYKNGGLYGSVTSYGNMTLCFVIDISYADGSHDEIVSGNWLKWTQSPILHWNFYYGEQHDYNSIRLEGWNKSGFDMSGWKELSETSAPESEYYFSDCPPDKVIRYITPKLLCETDDAFIYDMGENITGTPILESRTDGICKLEMRVSERLNPDGTIEDYTNHNQHSSFVTDGSRRKYSLEFCWNGFRYASVSKNARIVSCAVIHSDIAVTSSFNSDSSLLNWLNKTYIRTQLDNMHCGIPSDCPHIEKRGYTGDGELVCECSMLMLDAQKFYRKWLGDISDCQDTLSGHVQYTAPYLQSGGGPGGWGCAIAEVPYMYYKTYGDKTVLAEFLPKVLHYFDYLEAHSENDLVISDQKGEWCLGDWCTPEDIKIPEPFVNTYFYIKTINRLLEFCDVLGKPELAEKLKLLAEKKKAAVTAKYFDPETGDFCKNIQGADAFAVDLSLGDGRTLQNIAAHYEKETWYDTGIFGTDIVTRVLFEHGYSLLAYKLLTSKGKYSFYQWMSSGCTTFPEYWTYKRSQNHPMFGAVVRYLYIYLLGIQQEPGSAGYGRLVIKPEFVEGLDCAEGYITTIHGKVGVKYVKADGNINVRIEIPDGVCAKFVGKDKEFELSCGINEIILH